MLVLNCELSKVRYFQCLQLFNCRTLVKSGKVKAERNEMHACNNGAALLCVFLSLNFLIFYWRYGSCSLFFLVRHQGFD